MAFVIFIAVVIGTTFGIIRMVQGNKMRKLEQKEKELEFKRKELEIKRLENNGN